MEQVNGINEPVPAARGIQALFVEAWCNIENPALDCVNPHFKSRYSSLKETQRVIREACRPLGLAYRQKLVDLGEDGYRLCSLLVSAEGEAMEMSTFPIESIPNTQAFGSEMTYKKRQQSQADWGIVGEEDDDGNAATGSQQPKTGKGTQKRETARPRPSGGPTGQKQGKWSKLNGLKARAMELGIPEDAQKGEIAKVLAGKQMRDASEEEIRACEDAIQALVEDALEKEREEQSDGDGR